MRPGHWSGSVLCVPFCTSTQVGLLVKVLRPTQHKIGHFGDVPLLAWYGKTKPNTTEAHIHQSKDALQHKTSGQSNLT